MSTIGWFRPTIGTTTTTTLPNHSMKTQSLKLRACLIDYPLASKIIVRNLSYTTSESCLKEEFSNFGQIAEVKLVKDQRSKKSKGYAFVQYTNQDDAMSALEAMDEKYVDGRVVFVELAKPMDQRTAYPKTSGPPQGSSYSGQKQAED
ncbi:hypothetical protein M8C21_020505 [Ambrosia artemisiifolia]|uniref:RRM domain-containing protein n=1 Tax=Ambrosia artemisiifolia TaxID=4212 RepID=A0AAD5D3D1_AMBAR|nr:hypothetical protein M8C21_020505 [Ambrosia artemisiifolia]